MNERLGIDLKVLRILKGVSQEKMAEDLNISRSKVSSWETGRREMSLYDAIVISDYFEVSMDNLFNKKALNSEQVVQIVKRYFNNDKISLDEKKETLKKMLYFKSEREANEIISWYELTQKSQKIIIF